MIISRTLIPGDTVALMLTDIVGVVTDVRTNEVAVEWSDMLTSTWHGLGEVELF